MKKIKHFYHTCPINCPPNTFPNLGASGRVIPWKISTFQSERKKAIRLSTRIWSMLLLTIKDTTLSVDTPLYVQVKQGQPNVHIRLVFLYPSLVEIIYRSISKIFKALIVSPFFPSF